MEIKIVELAPPQGLIAALAGLFGIPAAPKPDSEVLADAAGQIIAVAERLAKQPAPEELEWHEDLPERMTWAEAKEAVAKLGDGWRLGTLAEWLPEIDHSKFNPALRDPAKFPGIKSEGYWTGTPGASHPRHYAWVVPLYYGNVGLHPQNYEFWVRPCRARRAASQ